MNEIIKVNKDGIKSISNKINIVNADIKSHMTELLQIVSNLEFAWNGRDKDTYISILNKRARTLISISKLLDTYNDTLNYVIEKNNALNSFDNIMNLYKDGKNE